MNYEATDHLEILESFLFGVVIYEAKRPPVHKVTFQPEVNSMEMEFLIITCHPGIMFLVFKEK
jgi:hypothetical protein